MERLTLVRNLKNAADRWEKENPIIGVGELRVCDALRDAAYAIEALNDRLADYEDLSRRWKLGISQMDTIFSRINALGGRNLEGKYRPFGAIDDFTALAKVRDEGRVVVLPCKVGDVVYAQNHHGRVVDGIVEIIHQSRIAGAAGRWVVTVYYPEYNGTAESGISADFLPKQAYYGFLDFGKTVFLTRAEAEAAPGGTEGC